MKNLVFVNSASLKSHHGPFDFRNLENEGSSKTCYKCSKAIAPILHVSNLNSYHKYYKSRESFILQLLFWFTISTSFSWEVEIYFPFPIYINPTQSCAWTLLVTFQSLEFDYERFSCELLMNALFWKTCYKFAAQLN